MQDKLRVIFRTYLPAIFLSLLALLLLEGQVMANFNSQGEKRAAVINQLLNTLHDEQIREQEPERLVHAIQRLGQMKAVEAVEDLAKLITFRRTFPWEDESLGAIQEFSVVTILSRYPAAGALYEIGPASLPVLVKVIVDQEPSSLASENAIFTIWAIFKPDPASGVRFLRNRVEEAPTPEATERLLAAAENMKKNYLK